MSRTYPEKELKRAQYKTLQRTRLQKELEVASSRRRRRRAKTHTPGMDRDLSAVWEAIGPGVAGAVCGAGWWLWVDAVVCSAVAVPFLHYLPGIFASFAALMVNCVRRDDMGYDYYSPYGGESEWRSKLWLFISYVVSFVSIAGAVGFLVQDALTDKGPSAWTGIAGVLQCVFVLVSGLIFWTCHSEN